MGIESQSSPDYPKHVLKAELVEVFDGECGGEER